MCKRNKKIIRIQIDAYNNMKLMHMGVECAHAKVYIRQSTFVMSMSDSSAFIQSTTKKGYCACVRA